ncbi:polysaccharide pyruvyl transferase family protein [Algibacter luteus]|uniref:Radical SAM superfamily enzyme, MoaA/NifB/PqqE/SkfB family n=1 Tax=Algibacter luteus TaxID=1178825 RepID=A0A1M6CFB6_9FLAO|nr:polysaccharide pyruvyl transferase family protein [Algibacter luteus]SHI59676.1 Radical SAM superfamily enzyme, MoaA/NifB/PqqE/SkfB family [Algibacter luteus]
MLKKIKLLFKKFNALLRLKLHEINFFNKLEKPTIINLNANDICNSKCTMCNIWKNKQDKEITYDDLKVILSDPLYSNVTGVGITGGEPTLREDLVDLYKACIDFLPKLKYLSIITNCINVKDVKRQLNLVNELCKAHNIAFSVMVSLDGYGEVHDKIRGREGNFITAIEVINFVKEDLKIPVSFGSTISKENVWEIDELLDFAKENNIYGRFRVAEFIKRLYNEDRSDVIRNFTNEESYHLALFFEKLKRTYEKNSNYKRTYTSIQNILLGGKRTIGCPYHKKGININAKGELAYCAPKSKIIGNGIESSSTIIYKSNLSEKKRILTEECDDCIHDYHAQITYKEQIEIYKDKFQKKFLKPFDEQRVVKLSSFLKSPILPKNKYSILIMGWYGTETVGDKAILASIINSYQNKYGEELNIIIGSLYPFITDQTIKELKVKAQVVNTSNFEFLRYSKACDEVIMGGGPLMDLNELYVPLLSFSVAKKYKKKRTIYGCGLGPINQEKYKIAIHKILELANEIKLRDKKSQEYTSKHFNNTNTEMIGDPAKSYIKQFAKQSSPNKSKILSLYLRDWEYLYVKGEMSLEAFNLTKNQFEEALAALIKKKAEAYKVEKIVFNHMHNFVLGGDDRDFSRRFIKSYFSKDTRVSYDKKLSTVDSIVESMKQSELNICMRFHSVLFAETLNTNFLAIDYTMGGKISSYISENSQPKNMLTIKQLIDNYHEDTIN